MTHVLVIDDEAPVRALLRQILETEGFAVLEAADGDAGIKLVGTTPVQLLITDIFMPGKEGIETIVTMRKHFPQVKVLAISGGGSRSFSNVLAAAKHLGAHEALAKPFTSEELLETVSTLLVKCPEHPAPWHCSPGGEEPDLRGKPWAQGSHTFSRLAAGLRHHAARFQYEKAAGRELQRVTETEGRAGRSH